MQLLQGWLGRVEKALPRKHLLSMVGGEAMASLILSPLLWQMPVTKRPRKSSSDLDQGSPSVTEEENSETSSESEKNSDQVRGFGDAVAGWRAEHPCGSGAEAGANLTGFTL